jgi:hypothetical protein
MKLADKGLHGTCKLLTDDPFPMPIPISPLAEQGRILDKVKELTGLCDRLGTQVNTA